MAIAFGGAFTTVRFLKRTYSHRTHTYMQTHAYATAPAESNMQQQVNVMSRHTLAKANLTMSWASGR